MLNSLFCVHRKNHCYWKSIEIDVAVIKREGAPGARPPAAKSVEQLTTLYAKWLSSVHCNNLLHVHTSLNWIYTWIYMHTLSCTFYIDCIAT